MEVKKNYSELMEEGLSKVEQIHAQLVDSLVELLNRIGQESAAKLIASRGARRRGWSIPQFFPGTGDLLLSTAIEFGRGVCCKLYAPGS